MNPQFHVTSATFSHSFDNFSQINKLTSSPACWIQNLPWKIFIEPVIQDRKKFLSFYVGCTESMSAHWSCRAVVEMYKLYGTTPKMIKANTSLMFDSAASTSWGHVQFIQWDTVLNTANGFIKNDAIIVEVTITAEIPVGLELAPNHYTDERANVESKEWIQEKQVLLQKIRNVNNLNQEIYNKMITSLKDNETLKNKLEMNKDLVQQLDDCKKSLENQQNKQENLQNMNKACVTNLNTETEDIDQLKKTLVEKELLENSYITRLQTADAKLKELIDIKNEKENLENKLVSLTKQLEDCKSVTVTPDSNNSNELCDAKVHAIETENATLKTRLSLRESQLNGSNAKLQKILENNSTQIKNLEVERDNLKTKLDAISGELESAKQKLSALQTESSEELDESKTEKQKLNENKQNLENQLKNVNTENSNLRFEKDELASKISTLQSKLDEISQTLNAVRTETKENENKINRLKTENQSLNDQMKIGNGKYNELKNEKDGVDSQLKLLTVNSSEKKKKADKLQKDIETKLKDLSACNEALQNSTKQNNTLSVKLLASNAELQEMKKKVIPLTDSSNEMKDLCEKLKLQISSLNSSLDESRKEVQRLKNKSQKRTAQDDNPNFEVDLLNENMTKQGDDMKNSKLSNSNESDKLAAMEEKYNIVLLAKTNQECQVEILRKRLEKLYKDAYDAFQEQNKNINNKLNELQLQLDEERNDKQRISDKMKDANVQLNEIKKENEDQNKTKNTLLGQLRECHELSKEVFWIMIELVKIKKSNDEMPCSLEARLKDILEILNKNKRKACLKSTSTDDVDNQPPSIKVSTDVIQDKLNDLEIQLEKEIAIVTQELKTEQMKRKKLILSITKLSALLENETFMSDQYKKLARVSVSRSEDIGNRLEDFNNQLFMERNKRFHYEEENQRLLRTIKDMEVQTDQLKKKVWKQALEVIGESPSLSSEDSTGIVNRNEAASNSEDAQESTERCATKNSEITTIENNVSSTITPTPPNETIVKQAEAKNDERKEKTQGARISESNPISLNNSD